MRRTLAVEGLLARGDMGRCPYSILALRDLLRQVYAALIDDPRATPPRSEDAVETRLVFRLRSCSTHWLQTEQLFDNPKHTLSTPGWSVQHPFNPDEFCR
jgi:hypothetical protein